jgi:hypothetical protein
MKINSTGDKLWSRSYHGERDDIGDELRLTSDGGLICAGRKNMDLDIYPFPLEEYGEFWVLRMDSIGDTLWTYSHGFFTHRTWVEETADSGFLVLGDYEWFKLDKDGNHLWQGFPFSSAHIGRGRCVFEIPEGYIVFGEDLIMTFDSRCEPLDLYDLEYSNCRYAQPTSDGGYVAVGTTHYNPYENSDIWIEKLDAALNSQWHRTYGDFGRNVGRCVKQTADGGYIITGEYFKLDSDLVLIKTDSLGYVNVAEENTPELVPTWQVVSNLSNRIIIGFTDCPQGFKANIFDASGRLIDKLYSSSSQGTISWGQGFSPGVYFVKSCEGSSAPCGKIVLIP